MDKVNGVINKMLKDDKQVENTYQTSKMRSEKRKETTSEPVQEKVIKQKPKRTRNTASKNNIQNDTTLEYEYDETNSENLGEMPDYTSYSDEYDD